MVNISVERKEDGGSVAANANSVDKLVGYIRIRSKTQGIALSLGDRITSIQRVVTTTNTATASGDAPIENKATASITSN